MFGLNFASDHQDFHGAYCAVAYQLNSLFWNSCLLVSTSVVRNKEGYLAKTFHYYDRTV